MRGGCSQKRHNASHGRKEIKKASYDFEQALSAFRNDILSETGTAG